MDATNQHDDEDNKADETGDAGDASSDVDDDGLDGLTERLGLGLFAPDHDPLLRKNIGGVTLVRMIAEGGMGRVYEGEQDKPRRPVAVKVMRPGFVSKEICRRFHHESEVLGRLRHPSVAQIYSAGVCTVFGAQVPYFVMEYIAGGLPITEYAKKQALTIDQRLTLFRRVCEAVAHGHEKGVVHRDLKPSNILVEPSGLPKVIDFGVARSIDASAEQLTALTDMGQLIGTVQYMSPEQFAADPRQIDTRADVYALGVILYELLTGQPPYEIRRKQIFEAAEVVRKQKPISPSQLNRSIHPDIDRITGKCLHKNRERRYSNAAELAHVLGTSLGADHTAVAHLPFRPWGSWCGRVWSRHMQLGWLFTIVCLTGAVWGFAIMQRTTQKPFTNSLGIQMVAIPAGRFTIGSPASEAARGTNETQREVMITTPFWIGKHEVTQKQWKRILGTEPWLQNRGLLPRADSAAVYVSWSDAVAFCRMLTLNERRANAIPDGYEYRLPTEAEWEYACRAGTTTRFSHGDSDAALDQYAWFQLNARDTGKTYPQPVGTRLANPWGLHDMHGNVWEWVLDAYGDELPQGDNPFRTDSTERRLLRGGSFLTPAADLRSARRHSGPRDVANNRFQNAGDYGFRVVLGPMLEPPTSTLLAQAPAVLVGFRGSREKNISFELVGHNKCPIWGSNPYTDDSCLATAAVHAGVLSPGQRGIVQVTLLPGLKTYPESVANGIRARAWGDWPGAFRIENQSATDGPALNVAENTEPGMALADLPAKRHLVGWGTFRAGHLSDVLVNGVVPTTVIAAHASSLVVYDLPNNFRGFFQGAVAVSDLSMTKRTPASCRFRVLGDDTILWESSIIKQDPLTGFSLTDRFRIPLQGFKKLSLEVDSLGANHSDWSVWVHPVLKWENGSVADLDTLQLDLDSRMNPSSERD